MPSFGTIQTVLHLLAFLLYVVCAGWGFYRIWKETVREGAAMSILIGTGLVLNLIYLFLIFMDGEPHRVPTLFEIMIALTAGVVVTSLLLQKYAGSPVPSTLGVSIAALLMGYAIFITRFSSPEPINLSFQAWLVTHISLIMISYIVFTVGFISGVLFLMQDRIIRRKRSGGLFHTLPSLEKSETISSTSILVAFPLLTLGIFVGILGGEYLNDQLASHWYQDPKVLLTLLTWIVYGTVLVLRNVLLVKGRKFAYLSVISFCLLLFTTLVGEFLWEGFHQFR